MSDEKVIYKSLEALKPVKKVLNEAEEALKDRSRTIETSNIPEILGAVTGVGTGGAVGYAALYFSGVTGLSAAGITSGLAAAGGLVGGGMVAGIGVIASPAVVLGVLGYALLSHRNHKKLIECKELLLQEAIRKQNAILQQLRQESSVNCERLDYLERLNTLLQAIIKDLEADLAKGGSRENGHEREAI